MKRVNYALLCGLAAVLAFGCDDDEGESPAVCQANYCQDTSTLVICDNHGLPTAVPCGAGNVCQGNACVPAASGQCTADVCKDQTTLLKCTGGVSSEVPCGAGNVCQGNVCVPNTSPTGGCLVDQCKDSSTVQICENGKYVDYSCGTGRTCKEGVCLANQLVPEAQGCVNQCTGELSQTYHACVNGSLAAMETSCPAGQVCVYGGCVEAFTEKDLCDEPAGKGYCTADGYHAVVCGQKSTKTIWTCKGPCTTDSDGFVDCPKKAADVTYEPQCGNDYKANCYNNNNNVHVCVNHQIESWTCYSGSCSVDDKNVITCPKNGAVAGVEGLETGGTYGDACNVKTYQEACIDEYFARICDVDGVVRLKPAGDCKISSTNPKKVEYDVVGSLCDTSDYMPFCINDGQAIGFCAYSGDDLSIGVYKASQCKNCNSPARAEECMRE